MVLPFRCCIAVIAVSVFSVTAGLGVCASVTLFAFKNGPVTRLIHSTRLNVILVKHLLSNI